MPTRENTQKHLPAQKAHMNEPLDEALKQTFPASDPIAINVEVQSPEARPGPPAPLRSGRKTPLTREG
jgi:hypothetical protein